jgi:transcriptional regulator with PAS, ATPase and Fis domain
MREKLHDLIHDFINHNFHLDEVVDVVEKVYIEKMLEKNNYNVTLTAKKMDIHRNTLTRKIKMLSIDRSLN